MPTPVRSIKKSIRALLADTPFLVAPGVHDMFALRAIEEAGFSSAAISGAVLSHAMLGMPDASLLGLGESVEHCRRLTRHAAIPITADADAGYGNALGVMHTVTLFEEAGAAGINLEDQVVPRRWGGPAGKEVVSTGEMVSKIAAACAARRSDDFVIIVRTDACACEPIESVLARVRAYEAAGADLLMPIGPRRRDDLARIVDAARVPVTLNAGTGMARAASSAHLSLDELRALGVRRVSLPNLLPVAATDAMRQQLRHFSAAQGTPQPGTSMQAPGVEALRQLMRDSDWLALEDRLLGAGVEPPG